MKKVFFGGSFDPPHNGHLGIAKAALASGKCSHVVWFPAADPPHKRNCKRAPFTDRMNMVKLLINGRNDMSVSDFESTLPFSPTYTVDVLEALKRFTGEDYQLLIGADSLLELHTWHNAGLLVEKTDFIIYPRPGATVTETELLRHWDKTTVQKLLSSMISGTFFEISSTEVRKSMEKNAFRHHIIESDGFSRDIIEYIREHHLYELEQ